MTSIAEKIAAEPQQRGRPAAPQELVIAPPRAWPNINLHEIREYRNLFFFLVWRDIKVRYAQTALGAGWAIIKPVVTMVVFTVIFGNLLRVPSDGIPFPLFSLSALVPWMYFSAAINGSANSLITNPSLISKIYFPRLIIPIVPILVGFMDFLIGFVILLLMMAGYQVAPSATTLVAVPVLVVLMMLTIAGVGFWMSALNIQYRDIKYVAPFLVQIWMYASPVIYPLSAVPDRYKFAYSLNPMVSVVEGFRSVLVGSGSVDWSSLVPAFAVGSLLFITGALYFRHSERVFADVV